MTSVMKCMAVMTTGALLLGSAASYGVQNKINKKIEKRLEGIAKDGFIPTGGMTKDGKLWDGQISVEEAKKNMKKQAKITTVMTGIAAAALTAVISGLTLLLRGKVRL